MMRAILKNALGIAGGLVRTITGGPLMTYVAAFVIGALLIHAVLQAQRLSACKTAHAEYVASVEKSASTGSAKALDKSQTAANEAQALDTTHEKELDDAKAAADRLRDDLAAARQQLRKRFTCPSTRAPRMPGVAAAAGQADEGAGLRPEDAGFLVGTGDACDADIRALQALALSYRKACNG